MRTTPLLEAGYVTPYAVTLSSAHRVVWTRAAASVRLTGFFFAGADAAVAGCNAETLTL